MMKRPVCLYFDVIVLMGNCLHATHHRNDPPLPPPFFGKKVSKVEGGPVTMDILTGKLKLSLFGLHLSGVHI